MTSKKEIYNSQAFKFILVGILNTLVGYGVYFTLLYFNIHYILSLLIANIVGITHSFIWNKWWTFRSNKHIKHELPKFITVYGVTFILNLVLLVVFVELLKFDKRIAQLFALLFTTVISYIGHKLWSFK
jgi:putative flippase GtrA